MICRRGSSIEVLFLGLLLSGAVGIQEKFLFPGTDNIVLNCEQAVHEWKYTPDGGSQTTNLPSDTSVSSTSLVIVLPNAEHEGLYVCLDSSNNPIETFNVTIYALAKFLGCPNSQSECDNGLTYNLKEGEPLHVNISLDFYYGGNRDVKQRVNFVFIRNPSAVQIVSWNPNTITSTNISPDSYNITFPVIEKHNVLAVINDMAISDAGIYTVEAQVSLTMGVATSSSLFTVMVASTTTTTTSMPVTLAVSSVTSSSLQTVSILNTAVSFIRTTTTFIDTTTTTSSAIVPTSSTTNTISSMSTSRVISSTLSYSSNGVASDGSSEITSGTVPPSTSSSLSIVIGNVENDNGGLAHGYIALIAVTVIIVALIIFVSLVIFGFRILLKRKDNKDNRNTTFVSFSYKSGGNGKGDENNVITTSCTPLTDQPPPQCNSPEQKENDDAYCTIRHSVVCSVESNGIYTESKIITGFKNKMLPPEGMSKEYMV